MLAHVDELIFPLVEVFEEVVEVLFGFIWADFANGHEFVEGEGEQSVEPKLILSIDRTNKKLLNPNIRLLIIIPLLNKQRTLIIQLFNIFIILDIHY